MQRGAAAVLREACSIRRSTLVVLARCVRLTAVDKDLSNSFLQSGALTPPFGFNSDIGVERAQLSLFGKTC